MLVDTFFTHNPTQIVKIHLPIDEDYKRNIIQTMYQIGDKLNYTTKIKASMTSWQMWEDSPIFSNLLSQISKIKTDCFWVDPKTNLELLDAWGIIYKAGEICEPHTHGSSLVSFSYYLQTDEYSSPINFSTFPPINISPKSGDLLLFKGDIEHSIPPQPSLGKDRIVISGNFVEVHPKTLKI